LGTIKNKKGHHLNTPPLWEESRAQHCQAKRYSWAKLLWKHITVHHKKKHKHYWRTTPKVKEISDQLP